MKKIIIFITVLIFASWGCETDPIIEPQVPDNGIVQPPNTTNSSDATALPEPDPGNPTPIQGQILYEFKDIDNNVYHAIQIGKQIWSQENLKTTHYNDGTQIPCIEDTSEWSALKSGAYCQYKNDTSNSAIYGLLYNYYTIASNKLAPEGWHVATAEEWENLYQEVSEYSGTLVDSVDWGVSTFSNMKDVISICNNSSGFTALPNGYRDVSLSRSLPEFDCLGVQASWWTSTKGELGTNGIIIYLDETFGVFPRADRPGSVESGIRLVKNAN